MIEARGIVKRFEDFTALDEVSVDVPTGSLTALLGPSGSGKSTLLRVVAGLERPDAGRVVLDGEDVTGLPPQSRGIGFVFQHYAALDARVRKELRAWLRRLHDETKTTTVIVTHDQEEAMEVADRVVVMNAGSIEQVAAPRELHDDPANEFVMSFVGPVNRLGDAFIRPHDVELLLEPNGTTQEAMVDRLVHLGFEVRRARP